MDAELHVQYVSDALESLLSAGDVREIVRETITAYLNKYDGGVESALIDRAKYYSAKCMGYPAVWFLSKAVGAKTDLRRKELIGAVSQTLLFSLSTSIADDFIDGDEDISEKDMFLFYVLIIGILTDIRSDTNSSQIILKTSNRLLLPILAKDSDDIDADIKFASTDRIGFFFEMIFEEYFDRFPNDCSEHLTLASRFFGRICCLIDDCIDFDKDISINGDNILAENLEGDNLNATDCSMEVVRSNAIKTLNEYYEVMLLHLEKAGSTELQNSMNESRHKIEVFIVNQLEQSPRWSD